jgi:hypothetical protein
MIDKNPVWYFESFATMGGTGARGLKRTLSGSGLEEAVLFGREIIQNCGDASIPDHTTKVRFRLKHLNLNDSKGLWRNLSGTEILQRDIIPSVNKEKTSILYIEDYNTFGLTGGEKADEAVGNDIPLEYKNRYIGLCMTFGNADVDAETGGTFGFGKSVLWEISNSGIVLIYSRFKKCKENSNVSSRFIACGLFNQHNFKDKRYTGRAFYGKRISDSHISPLTDDEADREALKFGFTERSINETGTSIAIIDTCFSTNDHLLQISKGIEKYYWPRIMDNKLEIEIIDDNNNIIKPNPKDRPALQPYILAYQNMTNTDKPFELSISNNDAVSNLSYYSNILGTFSIQKIENEESDGFDEDVEDEQVDGMVDTIALIRKQGMVINYHSPYKRAVDQHFAGVFVADSNMNKILAKSEPPTHNLWDKNVSTLLPDEKKKIEFIFTSLKNKTRDFITRQRQTEIGKSNHCIALDKLISDVVRYTYQVTGRAVGSGGRDKSPGGTPPPQSPPPIREDKYFSIDYETQPSRIIKQEDGSQSIICKIVIHILSKEKRSSSKNKTIARAKYFNLNVRAMVVVDNGFHDDEDLPIAEISEESGLGFHDNNKNQIKIPLSDEQKVYAVIIRTANLIHDEQTIDFKISGSFSTK